MIVANSHTHRICIAICLFIALFISQLSYGQITDSSTTVPSGLFNRWYLKISHQNKSDSLIFTSYTDAHGNGQQIYISEDGKFIDKYYHYEFGGDPGNYEKTGQWTYNSNTGIFETTIPIYTQGRRFRILKLTEEILIMLPDNTSDDKQK